jgi:hypothetical protein
LNDLDDIYMRKTAVMGSLLAENLFGSNNPVGETVDIEGVGPIVVVGVLEEAPPWFHITHIRF